MFSKAKADFFYRFDVKLTAYYTLICISIFIGLVSFFFYSLKHNLNKQIDSVLKDEALEFIKEFDELPLKDFSIEYVCREFEEEDTQGRKYFPIFFRVLSESEKLIYQSTNSLEFQFPAVTHAKRNYSAAQQHSTPLRIYESSIFLPHLGETILLQMATETTLAMSILDEWFVSAMMAFPILVLLCIIGGRLVAVRTRNVIRKITELTRRTSSRNLKERLTVPKTNDEIKDLILTINSMLNRLDLSFSQTKQFTSDVSHELRNPLSALQGELEISLSKNRSKEEYREVIGHCVQRTQFLCRMVKDLFLIANYDANKIPMELSHFDLAKRLQSIYEFYLPFAQEKAIDFKLNTGANLTLVADETKVLQVLNNLLDNALKFTPENGEVELSAQLTDEYIRIEVKDSGIGISSHEQKNIFNRFYQVEKARSGFERGSGLGLHICQRIVEIHNGRLEVSSHPGQGATFTLLLPVEQKEKE